MKRKNASGWNKLTEEQKNERIKNIRTATRNTRSKYSEELIKEIKNKFNSGIEIKKLRKEYPQVYFNLFYDLKNGRRWKDI